MKLKYFIIVLVAMLIPINACKQSNASDNNQSNKTITEAINFITNIDNTTNKSKQKNNKKKDKEKINKSNSVFNPYPNPWWTKAKYYSPCFRYINAVAEQFISVYSDEYPWWFNIGQLYAETGCRWEMGSSDGWGSIGPAQITPAFEGRFMRSLGLYNWETDFAQYFYGYARLMMRYLKSTNKLCYTGPTIQKRMWAWFQVYNTGPGGVVNSAITRAGVCNHDAAWKHCHGKWICVWKTRTGCRQWRNACDINFKYSISIYNYGLKYKQPYETNWLFW